MKRKIVCLGGGSLFFPGVIGDLVVREDLAASEIVLYDLDQEKSQQMEALGKRFAQEAGHGFAVRSAGDLADAVDGADFAISSIGGSGASDSLAVYGSYYHAADMYICAKYGLCQVIGDTGGPAGMMMGLRAIPAYIEICRAMDTHCPGAVLLSHSNPMAILCRAMTKASNVKVVGLCHGVQETVRRVAEILNIPVEQLDCMWIGTNHYYWLLRVAHDGKDLTEELLARVSQLTDVEEDNLWRRLSAVYGYVVGIPSANHLIEFYPWATRVGRLDDLAKDLAACARRHGFDDTKPMPTPQAATPESRQEFLATYQEILDQHSLPQIGSESWLVGEGTGRIIAAMAHGRREMCVANIPNNGLISNLPPTALVEVEAVTDSMGVRGVAVGDCPPVLKGMLEKRFAWQEMVVDAAVNGDRRAALQALMLDEMSLAPEKNEAMLDELLEASRDRLPQFFS
ncbi:MAG: family 4 glycosyl hydrolase [Planctomycetota bacterium]|jgi:alpha-galactosidase